MSESKCHVTVSVEGLDKWIHTLEQMSQSLEGIECKSESERVAWIWKGLKTLDGIASRADDFKRQGLSSAAKVVYSEAAKEAEILLFGVPRRKAAKTWELVLGNMVAYYVRAGERESAQWWVDRLEGWRVTPYLMERCAGIMEGGDADV